MTPGNQNSNSYEILIRQTFCPIFKPIAQQMSAHKVLFSFDLLTVYNLSQRDQKLMTDILTTFQSIEQKLWPLEFLQGMYFI